MQYSTAYVHAAVKLTYTVNCVWDRLVLSKCKSYYFIQGSENISFQLLDASLKKDRRRQWFLKVDFGVYK